MNNDIDALRLFTSFMTVLNYSENVKQTSNDELMQEMKSNINDLLKEILENQKEILRRLDNGRLQS